MTYRVAVYTLTRDRIDYTKACFSLLREKAAYEFDHYVVDNGSLDGTRQWLQENKDNFSALVCNETNEGISVGSNQALDKIEASGISYDLISKFDNDCQVVTDEIIKKMVDVFLQAETPMLLSPQVEGISRQPIRSYTIQVGDYSIGRTGIVGGLFHWLNASSYLQYRYPAQLPKAWGQDDDFCHWAYLKNIPIGYVEGLIVNHIDTTTGQANKYPEYFARKWEEETVKR